MTAFDNPWYAGMINRFAPDKDDEGAAIAYALVVSSCIIAQSIDTLASNFARTETENKSLADVMNDISCTLHQIKEQLKHWNL